MIAKIIQGFMIWLTVCSTGLAQDHAETRKTLTGIQEVEVVVHGLSEDLVNRGVTVELIKGEAESRLKGAGIEILSQARSPGFPILAVLVNAIKVSGETTFYAACIRVELRQTATLTRNREVDTHNVTWSSSSMVAAGGRLVNKAMRETLGTLLDNFVKSHQAANPAQRYGP